MSPYPTQTAPPTATLIDTPAVILTTTTTTNALPAYLFAPTAVATTAAAQYLNMYHLRNENVMHNVVRNINNFGARDKIKVPRMAPRAPAPAMLVPRAPEPIKAHAAAKEYLNNYKDVVGESPMVINSKADGEAKRETAYTENKVLVDALMSKGMNKEQAIDFVLGMNGSA